MLIRIVVLLDIEGVCRQLSLARLRIISKDHVPSLLIFLEEVRYATKLRDREVKRFLALAACAFFSLIRFYDWSILLCSAHGLAPRLQALTK